jgi:hypothetical protein
VAVPVVDLEGEALTVPERLRVTLRVSERVLVGLLLGEVVPVTGMEMLSEALAQKLGEEVGQAVTEWEAEAEAVPVGARLALDLRVRDVVGEPLVQAVPVTGDALKEALAQKLSETEADAEWDCEEEAETVGVGARVALCVPVGVMEGVPLVQAVPVTGDALKEALAQKLEVLEEETDGLLDL